LKIAIASVQVPFMIGGAEIHAASLCRELRARRIEADIVTIPFKWYPPSAILDTMLMARLIDLSAVNGLLVDRVITLKFPAYYIDHPCKVGWLLHQHRQAYDLFDTQFGDLHKDAEGRAVAAEVRRWDERYLPEHRALFANSATVRDRLRRYSKLDSEILYHPPGNVERLHCAEFSPYILAPGRFDPMKRQHLIIEAMAQLPETVKLVLIGPAIGAYAQTVIDAAQRLGDRVIIRGVVSEEEKVKLYANCLAVYNGVYDEDYGYVTLEGFFSGKPVITHDDSGGPLEFVRHGENGYVLAAEPDAIAACIRELAANPRMASEMGERGRALMAELGIGWDHVIERLLI
jgi:glycosyltransferase involved in cell wall biosynthesis